MFQITRAVKLDEKAMQKSIMTEFDEKLILAKKNNGNKRIPHMFVKKMIEDAKNVCPWLTYDKMMNFHRAQVKHDTINLGELLHGDTVNEVITASTTVIFSNTNNAINYEDTRSKEGRPVDSTIFNKILCDLAFVSAKSEMAVK